MVLVLLIGSSFIPQKSVGIPPAIKKLLVPGKIQKVLALDSSKETLGFLKTLAPEVLVGSSQIIRHGLIRIGTATGLRKDPLEYAAVARALDVDILVTDGSHFDAFTVGGRFVLIPGSVTGAFHVLEDNPVPSFVLIDVQPQSAVLYIYRLIGKDVKVEKLEFNKQLD
jgi:vacuolar protein sorting-associated protein 29